jgi:molybdopterin-containing oxidoreductase family membrane subunit
MAGVSGIGLLIVIAALLRTLLGEQERLSLPVFRWLGNLLMILVVIYLYFMLVDWLTATYQGHEKEVQVTQTLVSGTFAWMYWTAVVTLVVPFLLLFGQFLTRHYSLQLIVLSGILVNVAAVLKRVLIVVPSLTVGPLLPYGEGHYSPTWVEYSVIIGLWGLGALLYALFVKVFPIMEVPEKLSDQEVV